MEASIATAQGTAAGKLELLSGIRAPMLAHQPDERLVALTRLGNPAAFEALFCRYRARLVRFSENLLGASRPDAEDVVQEVMLSASAAMVADERPIDVRPWLYRITRNRCLSHLRDKSATTRPPLTGAGNDHLEHVVDGGASTAEHAESREELRVLLDDVRSLPETQRTAIILRELDGLTYAEVADVTDTTVSSVKSLLVRARLALVEIAEGRELDCREVRLALAAAEQRLGGLNGAERAHVRGCEPCMRVRKRLRTTTHGLAALSPIGLVPLTPLVASAIEGAGNAAAGGAGATAGGTAGTVSAAAAGGGGSVAAGGLLAGGTGALAMKGLLAVVTAGVVAAGGYSVGFNDRGDPGPPSITSATAAPPPEALPADPPADPRADAPDVASPDPAPPPVVVTEESTAEAPAPVEVVEQPSTEEPADAPPRGLPGFSTTDVEDPRGYPGAEEPVDEPPPPTDPTTPPTDPPAGEEPPPAEPTGPPSDPPAPAPETEPAPGT